MQCTRFEHAFSPQKPHRHHLVGNRANAIDEWEPRFLLRCMCLRRLRSFHPHCGGNVDEGDESLVAMISGREM